MPGAGQIPLGALDGLETDILIWAGGGAGLAALLGVALVLPLFMANRREIQRLTSWLEREPSAGEGEGAQGVPAATAATKGLMSAGDHVAVDRPTLGRITAERAAIQSPSPWRRLLAAGPRHPLVISGLAILLAAAAVAVVALTGKLSSEEGGAPGALDRADVGLVVLNGSSEPALAAKVADSVSAAGFTRVRTGVTGSSKQTVVLYEPGARKAAKAVSRELAADSVQPIDRVARAAAAGAEVVVVAGEDRAK